MFSGTHDFPLFLGGPPRMVFPKKGSLCFLGSLNNLDTLLGVCLKRFFESHHAWLPFARTKRAGPPISIIHLESAFEFHGFPD